MTLTLTLPMGEFLYTGKQVTFKTPCESEGLTGLIVEGITYDIVNALGTPLVANSFDAGAMVSVIFDKETKKAYVQNADTNAYLENRFNNINVDTSDRVAKAGDTMTGYLTLHADPSDKLHAATKQYVDTTIETAIGLAIGGSY